MKLLIEPRFRPSERSFSLQEVQRLLNVSDAVMRDLLVKNVSCKSAYLSDAPDAETLIHSALDILASHLFLKLEDVERSFPHRQLLAIATVSILEESWGHSQESLVSLGGIRVTLANSGELRALHFEYHEERLALEICSFWPGIRRFSGYQPISPPFGGYRIH